MKRTLFVALPILLFLTVLILPNSQAHAASATCAASPAIGPVGTLFSINCSGFGPDEPTFAWVTEPDGATFSYGSNFAGPNGASKTDALGNVTYRFATRDGDFVFSLGEWAMTVKTASAIGIGRFTVTGGTEGVSGATLANVDGTIVGSGFAPFEFVTVWIDYPNGDCSANWLAGPGLSSRGYGTFKTDGSGGFAFVFAPDEIWDCSGTYHLVARGNTSGLGAETYWTSPNHPQTESATLVASPDKVLGILGFISFAGSGYAPLEFVTCWETTPQGAVLPLETNKANGSGEISFGFHTGANIMGVIPSEGALGEWAATCRGNSSGRIGIARFTVIGGLVDP